MAGELNIMDETLEQEFLACSTPIAFIDFETIMPGTPGLIPGATITDLVPVQWSSHTMYEHGLEWRNNLRHGEFLWTGDVEWNPIYAFVQSLYDETADANSIWIYTSHEILSLKSCKRFAENDMEAMSRNDVLSDMYYEDENGELQQLAYAYRELCEWCEDGGALPFPIYDEMGEYYDESLCVSKIRSWYASDPLPYDYLVMDGYGNKVPLMEIAPYVAGWCDSMMSRMYDQCYGVPQANFKQGSGGVRQWLQSAELHQSNSIKYVMPAAMKEFSESAELLASEGEPENGYEGLRAMGYIAKGDECQSYYMQALTRDPRPGVPFDAPGAAPFDENIEAQCLIYCRLDTLSMVLIYLAVLEATQRWREEASMTYAGFAMFPDDGLMHFVVMDGDRQEFYKGCDEYMNNPYPYSYELELYTEEEFENLPIVEQYEKMCPRCRRIRNMS